MPFPLGKVENYQNFNIFSSQYLTEAEITHRLSWESSSKFFKVNLISFIFIFCFTSTWNTFIRFCNFIVFNEPDHFSPCLAKNVDGAKTDGKYSNLYLFPLPILTHDICFFVFVKHWFIVGKNKMEI